MITPEYLQTTNFVFSDHKIKLQNSSPYAELNLTSWKIYSNVIKLSL